MPSLRAVVVLAVLFTGALARDPPDLKKVGLAGNYGVTGVHLDVEPHALGPAWANNSANLSASFVDVVDAAWTLWTQQSSLPITWDLPVWYDTVSITHKGQTRPLSELVIDRMSRVGFMNFRNEIKRLTDDVAHEAEYAQSKGKPFVITVETQYLPDSPAITFWDQGPQRLKTVLLQLDGDFKSRMSMYDGIVVHDYNALQIMPDSNIPYPTAQLPISLYVWNWPISYGKKARQALWAFIAQSAFKIHTILFESEVLLYSYPGILQSFVNEAASKGVRVELTMGEPDWALPAAKPYVLDMIQRAATFSKGNAPPVAPPDDIPEDIQDKFAAGNTHAPVPLPGPSSKTNTAASTTGARSPPSSSSSPPRAASSSSPPAASPDAGSPTSTPPVVVSSAAPSTAPKSSAAPASSLVATSAAPEPSAAQPQSSQQQPQPTQPQPATSAAPHASLLPVRTTTSATAMSSSPAGPSVPETLRVMQTPGDPVTAHNGVLGQASSAWLGVVAAACAVVGAIAVLA